MDHSVFRGDTTSRAFAPPRLERQSATTLHCYVPLFQPPPAPWHPRPTLPAVPQPPAAQSERNPRVHGDLPRSSRLRAEAGK
jgi:hypothetical protein